MSRRRHAWDLVVVGGGTAGIVGATTAARLGAHVALIERDRPGGDCLWTGCVPSKALLAAAGRAADARRAASLGVQVTGVSVDLAAVLQHVRSAIAAVEPQDSPAALRAAGVHVIQGEARFTGLRLVRVGGESLTFHQALLATGARPALPPVPGLAAARPLTSETVWDLATLPSRLVVLGGGSIGCELGQAFARLGASVTLVEAAARLLPREDTLRPSCSEVRVLSWRIVVPFWIFILDFGDGRPRDVGLRGWVLVICPGPVAGVASPGAAERAPSASGGHSRQVRMRSARARALSSSTVRVSTARWIATRPCSSAVASAARAGSSIAS